MLFSKKPPFFLARSLYLHRQPNDTIMKTSGRLAVVVALVAMGWFTSFGQSVEPEVPGDQFSLEGALELFKKSASPEEFEKMLNSPDSKVNNLDLNGDGYIDYIRVLDRYEGNVHAFILQAVISERESQDIAVIELEKLANGKAVLQIVGDEDIYGVTTIIEPTREVRTYAGTTSTRTVVNVWAWPSVQYVYGPYYSGWVSPWGWHHRPRWYRTWRPIAYVHYYPIWRPYYSYYAPCYTRRIVYAHNIYHPHRRTSVVVRNRYDSKITRYRTERRNDDRYGRTRDDDRRANVNSSRSSSERSELQRSRENVDANRRSIISSDEVSPDRSASTDRGRSVTSERSVRSDLQRNSTEVKRTPAPVNSRSSTEANRRTVRPQMEPKPPVVNRSRSTPAPSVQQRPATRERSAPANIQRRSPSLNREAPSRNNTPQIRQQTSRPATVNRAPSASGSRSAGTPSVQRQSTSKSSSSEPTRSVRRGRQ